MKCTESEAKIPKKEDDDEKVLATLKDEKPKKKKSKSKTPRTKKAKQEAEVKKEAKSPAAQNNAEPNILELIGTPGRNVLLPTIPLPRLQVCITRVDSLRTL